MPALGEKFQIHAFSLRGTAGDDQEILKKVSERIGMTSVNTPVSWHYPTDDGKGGVGTTTVMPITESFLAIDSWPVIGGKYLVICSCRDFKPGDVEELLVELGCHVKEDLGGTIGL